MDEKTKYILTKLQTDSNQIIKTDSYIKFFREIGNESIDKRFEIMAKVATTGPNELYDESIVSNCKIHLKTKAFSGITGSITEKNINYIYDLINKV